MVQFMWDHGSSTAEGGSEGPIQAHHMKDATLRAILRRLEAEGYATHEEDLEREVIDAGEPKRLSQKLERRGRWR